jgi:hypothetical protein
MNMLLNICTTFYKFMLIQFVTPCRRERYCQCFGDICCLHFQMGECLGTQVYCGLLYTLFPSKGQVLYLPIVPIGSDGLPIPTIIQLPRHNINLHIYKFTHSENGGGMYLRKVGNIAHSYKV